MRRKSAVKVRPDQADGYRMIVCPYCGKRLLDVRPSNAGVCIRVKCECGKMVIADVGRDIVYLGEDEDTLDADENVGVTA